MSTNEIKKKSDDKVIRVHKTTYAMIRELKGSLTYDEFINSAVAFSDAAATSEQFYVVGDKAFRDLLDARGEALLQAVQQKRQPIMPTICVAVGRDNV